jgi:predicted RNA-binding protein associated with RNAse of E/G family
MTVIHDELHDLALYRAPGYPLRRRNAKLETVPGFRHQPLVRHLDGWKVEPVWSRWRVIVLMDPDAFHAVSLFRDAGSGALEFWYIDIIGPARRRSFGFDFIEHGLDIVVEPDLSTWHWKDEDELEWNVRASRYQRAEADALYAEGERAVERLQREQPRFDEWRSWQPDPEWSVAAMPEGWDKP